MMVYIKCFVYMIILVIFPVNCLDIGDSCLFDKRNGECRQLRECPYWIAEIEAAGSPMPSSIRRKLQSSMCGFYADQPVVCCIVESITTLSPFDNAILSDQPTEAIIHNHWGDWHREDNHKNSDNSDLNTESNWHRPHNHNSDDSNNSNAHCDNKFNENRDEDTNSRGNNHETSNIDTNRNDIREPPDVSRHRNLKLLPTNCGVLEDNRIWGGNRTSLYEMPWMVLIAYNSPRGLKLSCGGTLVTRWYVLTAAHCVTHLSSRMTLRGAIIGEHDVRTDPDCERVEGVLQCAPAAKNVTFDKVIPHPGYSPQNLFDDVALVRLSEPADFSLDNIKPICLPSSPELQREELTGLQGVVAGWGATEDGLQSPILLSVELPVVSNEECETAYNGNPRIYKQQMCAGGLQDRDSCGGDSGGPLLYPGRQGSGGLRYVQRGIVSFGSKRCAVGGLPGVYTRIAYYMDWILDNISE